MLKNRKIENILLVDNAAYSYFYQLENGIPILPFYDDKQDRELVYLTRYIEELIAKYDSGQEITYERMNQEYFKLAEYSNFESVDHLINALYKDEIGKK